MNTNGPIADKLIQLIIDELGAHAEREIAYGASVLRKSATRVTFVPDEGEGPFLIIWMRDITSYFTITDPPRLCEIEDIARGYLDHMLGSVGAIHVVIGLEERYRHARK